MIKGILIQTRVRWILSARQKSYLGLPALPQNAAVEVSKLCVNELLHIPHLPANPNRVRVGSRLPPSRGRWQY